MNKTRKPTLSSGQPKEKEKVKEKEKEGEEGLEGGLCGREEEDEEKEGKDGIPVGETDTASTMTTRAVC